MLRQPLPDAATDYDTAQRREVRDAVLAVRRRWRRMGGDFDASWARIGPIVAAIVAQAQARTARRASLYIPAVLEATGQTGAIPAVAQANAEAIVGLTGAGVAVIDSLSTAPIRAKQAVSEGASQYQALDDAGKWMSRTVGTILADSARAVEAVETYTRPIGGYVRMLTPPSCGRCVVMAGRWYRTNTGFERHPGCDCKHIPAAESVAGDLTVDPRAYFDSLDAAGQVKLMGGRANAQAVRDGADIGQIINAYRKTSGMQLAQAAPIQSLTVAGRRVKFTTAGTTRRGAAYKAMRSHGAVRAAEDARARGERYFRAKPVRVMPETIARYATSRDERLRLLRLYGWIR